MANALHQPDQWSPDFQSPAVVGWTPSIRVCHSNRGSPTDEVVGWTPSHRVCHSIRRSPTDEVVGWTPSHRVCHSIRRSPTDDGMWICHFRGSSCSPQGPCAVSLGPKTGRSTYTEPKEYVLLQTLEHCSKTLLVKFQGPSQTLGPETGLRRVRSCYSGQHTRFHHELSAAIAHWIQQQPSSAGLGEPSCVPLRRCRRFSHF